jgi:hypothetical protein
MTYNGKTATATITDQCPGCPWAGLDLSRGLFNYFASESEGIIYGSWRFADDNSQPPAPTTTSTTPAWTPPTTTQEAPSPTTTSTPTSTSTTPTWSSSSSSSSWSDPSVPSQSSSSSSPSSVDYGTGAASNLAVPTPATISDTSPHNLLTLNDDVIALAALVVAGGRA